MTLTRLIDYNAAYRGSKPSTGILLTAKGTGTDDVYLVEVDPSTGQIPVNTTGGGLSQVLADQVQHNSVNLATAVAGPSAAPGTTLKVTYDCASYKQAVLHLEWASLSATGVTVQVYTARNNTGAAYIAVPDLLYTMQATSGQDFMILFPLVHRYIEIVITPNGATAGTITTSLTLKGPF